MASIPEDLRPKAYASLELLLDVIHSTRSLVQADLESIAIYLCVAEATMRPVLADPARVHELSTTDRAPEEWRGSITMLQVADRLGLSVKTVETYKSRLMTKLGLTGRAALVRYALQQGLLEEQD